MWIDGLHHLAVTHALCMCGSVSVLWL